MYSTVQSYVNKKTNHKRYTSLSRKKDVEELPQPKASATGVEPMSEMMMKMLLQMQEQNHLQQQDFEGCRAETEHARGKEREKIEYYRERQTERWE